MEEYCRKVKITEKTNSVNAIYNVGKGDGVYLGLINDDGTIKDKEFFREWINMYQDKFSENSIIYEMEYGYSKSIKFNRKRKLYKIL